MLIKHDKQADAKYIVLLPEKQKKGVVKRTEKIQPWLLVDYDKDGNIFAIEILDASEHDVTLAVMNNKVRYFPRATSVKPKDREAMFTSASELGAVVA